MNHEIFGDQFGAPHEDIELVAEFARSHDLKIILRHENRRSVVVEGRVKSINEAFGITLYQFESPKGNYHGFDGQVHLPASIIKVVESVIGLDNRPLDAMHFVADPNDPPFTRVHKPQDVAVRYHFPPGSGIGQTIGIYEMSTIRIPNPGYNLSDVTMTLNSFGAELTVPNIIDVSIDGQVNSGVSDLETVLDITVASTIANAATIAVYFAPLSAQGILHALQAMVHPLPTQPVPTVISISYTWGFDFLTNFLSDDDYTQLGKLFRDAADLQITVLASTGDLGATFNTARPYAAYPASDPMVLACGGSVIGNEGYGIETFEEYVWNDGTGATGGGISDRFVVPSYQSGLALPVQGNTGKAGRGIPDVAGNASNNSCYKLFIGGVQTKNGVGGTSAVCPLYAGLIAIINSQLRAAGAENPAGFINILLYDNAAIICRDVTAVAGPTNNAYNGTPGYIAGLGWDACTGLGSIRGNQLLNALRPLGCQIIFKKKDNCDPGPVAGTIAEFTAEVSGGVGPFVYYWEPVNAAKSSGGGLTDQKISLEIPPVATVFSLKLTVEDIAQISVTFSVNYVSLDPEIAAIEHALCEFVHWGYQFKPPIYINPGDPYRNRIFSVQELMGLNTLAGRVFNLTESILRKQLTFETGKLQER